MGIIIEFQPELSQRLPEVVGNLDYRIFRDILNRIDELIKLGDLEKPFIEYRLHQIVSDPEQAKLSTKKLQRLIQTTIQGFRCVLALKITRLSFRKFSERLADSALLQKFCQLNRVDKIKVPSKSQIERYEKMFPESLITEVIEQLCKDGSHSKKDNEGQILRLKESLDLEAIYIDATCLEANIHFPVDWVLLRDATRTLMKAVALIRKNGLKHRMNCPSTFIREMNKLSIAMTHAKNRMTRRKQRKKILRLMKKLMMKIHKHALNHQVLLKEHGQKTELTKPQMNQILKRIEGVLEKLPKAIHQAHERIIGDRQVDNKDKILSLYEEDLHVSVRGKAGISTEFGNTLVLGEQRDGLIIDWKLYQEKSPGDAKLLKQSLQRIQSRKIKGVFPQSVTTDRGMFSKNNQKYFKKFGFNDFMAPKSPKALEDRLQDPEFRQHQKRRAQTEGRIGILKKLFLGNPLRSKGFQHRSLSVAWAVLTHNLWVIARLPQEEKNIHKKAA